MRVGVVVCKQRHLGGLLCGRFFCVPRCLIRIVGGVL